MFLFPTFSPEGHVLFVSSTQGKNLALLRLCFNEEIIKIAISDVSHCGMYVNFLADRLREYIREKEIKPDQRIFPITYTQ